MNLKIDFTEVSPLQLKRYSKSPKDILQPICCQIWLRCQRNAFVLSGTGSQVTDTPYIHRMNKVVLITGSASGIGFGIAREFAKAGYAISFHGLENDGAEISAAVGTEFGVPVFFSNANLLDADAIEKFITDTEATLGAIDILVNNAGIQHVSSIEDFAVNQWNDVIGVNLTAIFHTTRLVLNGMKRRKWGRIINIASVHGVVASEFKSAYVSAKHGLLGFTKVTALEGAPFGITANAICPGYVDTPLVRNQLADQARLHDMTQEEVIEKVMLLKQPIKKFVQPESIGALCVFLASDHAALMTGTAIPMDGGWTAQ